MTEIQTLGRKCLKRITGKAETFVDALAAWPHWHRTGATLRRRKPRPRNHKNKGNKIGRRRHFPENHQGETCGKEGCNRIISAGPRRSKESLCIYIEIDAQSVGHKSQPQNRGHVLKCGYSFTDARSYGNRPNSGKNPLQKHNLQRIPGRYLPGTVVLKSPENRSQEHKQGAVGELQACYVLEGQQGAGQCDTEDSSCEKRANCGLSHSKLIFH